MAWPNPPPTFSVGEVVTAAKMNQLRDGLRYLKGLDGTVTIESGLIVQGNVNANGSAAFGGGLTATTLSLSSASFPVAGIERTSASSTSQLSTMSMRQKTSAGSMSDGFGVQQVYEIEKSTGGPIIIGSIGAVRDGSDSQGALTFKTNSTQSERMRLTQDGNLGIGTSSPALRLHANVNSYNCGLYGVTITSGTSQTVLANGSVIVHFSAFYMVRASSGFDIATMFDRGLGESVVITGDGGTNALTVTVNGSGGVTVQRTSGTATWELALWCLWK